MVCPCRRVGADFWISLPQKKASDVCSPCLLSFMPRHAEASHTRCPVAGDGGGVAMFAELYVSLAAAPAPHKVRGEGLDMHLNLCHRPLSITRLLFSSCAACKTCQAPAAHSTAQGNSWDSCISSPKMAPGSSRGTSAGRRHCPRQQGPPRLPRASSNPMLQAQCWQISFCKPSFC